MGSCGGRLRGGGSCEGSEWVTGDGAGRKICGQICSDALNWIGEVDWTGRLRYKMPNSRYWRYSGKDVESRICM